MADSGLRFTWEDWERIERDTMAWWAGELERPLVMLSVVDDGVEFPSYRFLSNYALGLPAEEIVDRFEPGIGATRWYGDAFPCWWVNLGPGIMAGFLGASVHSVREPSETVWFGTAGDVSLRDLALAPDPSNAWWGRATELTRAMVKRWEGRLAVGHTDLGGNLDILASFCTSEGLLYSVVDHPEHVERLAGRITELWLDYYGRLDALIRPPCRGTTCWAPLWSTGKTYMLQCDFAYMISPAMFERFVVPDLTACCAYLDHGFYHLDGRGQIVHLDHLLAIERLRGIQWVPGDGQPPPEEWLPLLKRIRDAGKRVQVFVSPEGALEIARALGGRGFMFVVSAIPEFRDPAQVEAFLGALAEEGATAG